jgi:ABC-type sulfate transport system permease component
MYIFILPKMCWATFWTILKNSKSSSSIWTTFSTAQVLCTYLFCQKCVGQHFGQFFHNFIFHLVTLPTAGDE